MGELGLSRSSPGSRPQLLRCPCFEWWAAGQESLGIAEHVLDGGIAGPWEEGRNPPETLMSLPSLGRRNEESISPGLVRADGR